MSDFRLRVFSSVAKNLSFTKASQELFISQPAIAYSGIGDDVPDTPF